MTVGNAKALPFLYGAVLDRPMGDLGDVVKARGPARLPIVLTRAEVFAVGGRDRVTMLLRL